MTTIIFNKVRAEQSARRGVQIDSSGKTAPLEAQLLAYRAAEWGGFAFGIIGELLTVCALLVVF